MTYQPSAQDAKKLTEESIYAVKKLATETFLTNTLVSIDTAAKTGAYRLTVSIDNTLDLEHVTNVLQTRLGYSLVPALDGNSLMIDWQSSQRKQISVPNSNINDSGFTS